MLFWFSAQLCPLVGHSALPAGSCCGLLHYSSLATETHLCTSGVVLVVLKCEAVHPSFIICYDAAKRSKRLKTGSCSQHMCLVVEALRRLIRL